MNTKHLLLTLTCIYCLIKLFNTTPILKLIAYTTLYTITITHIIKKLNDEDYKC